MTFKGLTCRLGRLGPQAAVWQSGPIERLLQIVCDEAVDLLGVLLLSCLHRAKPLHQL